MSFANKSRNDLISLCKENNIKGYSKKNKEEIIKLLSNIQIQEISNNDLKQEVICGDSLLILPTIEDNSAQIIIADRFYFNLFIFIGCIIL